MLSTLKIALLAAEAADSKKSFDILVLDLRGLTSIADYFVICSAGSITQVGAIADSIDHALTKEGCRPSHIEGKQSSTWVLMDYRDVVIHVFDEHTRSYFCLERLWGDAPSIPLSLHAPVLKGSKL